MRSWSLACRKNVQPADSCSLPPWCQSAWGHCVTSVVYLCHASRPANVPLVQPALPLQPPLYVHRRRFAANFVSFAPFPVQYPHLKDFSQQKTLLVLNQCNYCYFPLFSPYLPEACLNVTKSPLTSLPAFMFELKLRKLTDVLPFLGKKNTCVKTGAA